MGPRCEEEITKAADTTDHVTFYIVYYGILYLITLVSLGGNSLVLSCWFRHKNLRASANAFVYLLAISDLVQAISYTIYNTSHIERDGIIDTFSHWEACMAVLVFVTGSQMSSSYHLVLLTVSRYMAVVSPLVASRTFTGQRSLILSGCVWVVSLILALTVSVGLGKNTFHGVCRYETFVKLPDLIGHMVSTFLLPLFIMVLLYARLACYTHKQACRISDDSSLQGPEYNQLRSRMIRKNVHLAKMAALLVGYFIFAWLPLFIFLTISSVCSRCEKSIPGYVRAGVRLIVHSNTAVNVFIYAGRHPDFRQAFLRDLLRFCCCAAQCKQRLTRNLYENSDIALQTVNMRTVVQSEMPSRREP